MTTVYSLVSCQVSAALLDYPLIKQHLEISFSAGFSHCKVTVFPFVINEYWGGGRGVTALCNILLFLELPLTSPYPWTASATPSRLALVAFALGSAFLSQSHLSNSLRLHVPPPSSPLLMPSPFTWQGRSCGFPMSRLWTPLRTSSFHLTPLFSSLFLPSLPSGFFPDGPLFVEFPHPSNSTNHILYHFLGKNQAWILNHTFGLHPPGPQALCLPSFKTKERAWSQKHQWPNACGATHLEAMSLERHPTAPWAGRTQPGLHRPGQGRLSDMGHLSDWLMSYQGNQQRSTSLLSGGDVRSQIRMLISWGGVKYVKVSQVSSG